jgi:hypothetical protein
MWNENTSESNLACFSCVYFLNPLKARTMKTHKYFASFTLGFKYSRNTMGFASNQSALRDNRADFRTNGWENLVRSIPRRVDGLSLWGRLDMYTLSCMWENRRTCQHFFSWQIFARGKRLKKSRRITSSAVKSDDQYI